MEVHFDEMILHRGGTRRSCDLQFPLWNNYVKLEGSNFKGTSCSRIIAWSVNDLSCLLRPEKKERKGEREQARGEKVAATALQELLGDSQSVKMATLGSIYALKVGHFAVAHCQRSHVRAVPCLLQSETGNHLSPGAAQQGC